MGIDKRYGGRGSSALVGVSWVSANSSEAARAAAGNTKPFVAAKIVDWYRRHIAAVDFRTGILYLHLMPQGCCKHCESK